MIPAGGQGQNPLPAVAEKALPGTAREADAADEAGWPGRILLDRRRRFVLDFLLAKAACLGKKHGGFADVRRSGKPGR